MSTTARSVLEIAAGSLSSALAAQRAGADRVELCEGLESGGTTPSYGTLAAAREQLGIPLFVLVRPRAGDFLYTSQDADVMLRDIECCVRLGCDGIVVGALDADGDVDPSLCRQFISAAGPLSVTFHRAFDVVRDPATALEQVIELGFTRVLTSGGTSTAVEGADAIAARVRQAAERIVVMPGAGITADNVVALARATGAREFHASAKTSRSSAMRFQVPALQGLASDWSETDSERVRALRIALDTGALA
ncbi:MULTISPECIES: copper homeostasis protein CutC [unclassified Pseudoxanthomonas]|uniref:copper homeostasis protein CutC n=1 Tax=unclassified Pseudoxanthomonas TaxID=2645906 RepID=UPI0008ED7162|nr:MULTISPECIES: copper homeostasis protein CutC [unclassified Pseudoxanthomonas]PPJ41326.1 copper homeostasis protein CutC [Pseudoxanthomonas sp. KAs_5_3]SFV30614.1 copper homeostasis protein [Pseudoxanthomonas sp. YR558]